MSPTKDYSREAFATRIGPPVMAEIEQLVAEAPPLAPEQIDTLRRIFAQARPADATVAA
jgi:hypothetical protein